MTTQTKALKLALERYMAAYGQALEAHGIELQQQQIEADKCAREALAQPEPPDLDAICQDLQEKTYNQAMRIAELEAQLAQPEQEPVAWLIADGEDLWATNEKNMMLDYPKSQVTPLYTTPPQRKPQFKEFIKWAGAQGYDCAQTCNSDTGEWIVLNPMTADLWKSWQAAHGIKE